MKNLNQLLEEELKFLENIKSRAEYDIANSPGGRLRVSKSNNSYQYYHVKDSIRRIGSYINKNDISTAQALAQKSYAQKILTLTDLLISKEKALLEAKSHSDVFEQLAAIYSSLSTNRKSLTTPYLYDNDTNAAKWLSLQLHEKQKLEKQSSSLNTYFKVPAIAADLYTMKGEKVRSKSEMIIANMFFKAGIPYIYEMPLIFPGSRFLLPDFKVLNKRTRKEYYWEHFGIMDDEKYSTQTVKKLEMYEKNNIFIGDALLTSFETKENVLNSKVIEHKIQRYLL